MPTHRRARPPAMALALAALTALPLAGCDDPLGSGGRGPTPRLALTSPAPGQVVDADSVVVEGTATDDRGVARVTFRLNGGAELAAEVAPGREVAFRFVARGLRVGQNELEVLAYDEGERVAARKVALGSRDAAAPTVQLRTPADAELVPRDSVVIAGVAADERRVASLTYALDGGAEQPVALAAGREAPFALTLRGAAPGEHTVVLTARDEAGNAGTRTVRFTTSAVRVTINLPRPDTTVTAFALYVGGQMEGPVLPAHFSYSVNGGPEVRSGSLSAVYTVTGVPGVYNYWGVVDSLPRGPATIRVFANDGQGREIGVGSVTVDVSVPVKQYSLTPLDAPRGGDGRGTALNEKGQAVGTWSDGTSDHAWAWDGARMIDLEAETGWTASAAAGINEGGEVVGTFRAAGDACTRSFRYRIGQDGPARRLLEECDHLARDVNDAGTVLVSAPAADPRAGVEGYLLDGQARRRLLPEGTVTTYFFQRLNNRDQALGALFQGFFGMIPAVFSTAAAPAVAGVCVPVDMDDTGRVAYATGCKSVTFGSNGAVGERQVANPGVPTPYARVNPSGINNRGEAVGMYLLSWRTDAAGVERAVTRPLFWDGARSHDVSVADADWRVDGVKDVNDAGVILAHAVNTRTGWKGTVLLTPRS